ncbi:cobalamin-binding protein [Pleionea sp. CnH1-48]|uniref:cobalamin-binding protein n=1 Tax=Pleionea sp. CnH1-48 TaxID=2954494 RepID=UPI0020979997|nr:cobalamin-binding protein [Pleionea sp. CnH1-48]MCO7225092.1 cobalamin-binding protein [Pleionea sp. CnH1-48]
MYPTRIVCLTEETTEALYLMGEQDRIVGVSGYTVRPPQARKEKPKVSAFTSAKIDKILALEPDLVLGFSDMQADIAAELIRAGVQVHVFNQRSIEEIYAMIRMLGSMIGCIDKAQALIHQWQQTLDSIDAQVAQYKVKPKVYFEEWYEPLITGIGWVSELIERAGGEECFPEKAGESLGKNRIIENPDDVIERQPDIILGSWCGRKFRPEKVAARAGWDAIPAVKNQQIFEIKSADILQPGPAALTDGVRQIADIISRWHQQQL